MATDFDPQLLERPAGVPAAAADAASPGSAHGSYSARLDEAEIIGQFVPVVKRLALRLKGRLPEAVQLDDLIQAGLIAVLRLARHAGLAPPADPGLQRSIVNAMIDEVRREVWAPVRTLRLAKTAGKAMHAVKLRLGRDGDDEEIAAEMGLTLGEYHVVLVEIAGIRLLHLDEDDDRSDHLRAADDQDAALDRSRMMAALAEAIAELPERERLVLSLYYEQELSMEEVGAVLDLDKSTICRTHGRALLMLRAMLSDWRAEPASPLPGTGE
jgi:RNA polymerase sigma factor for flagellar operon FliA